MGLVWDRADLSQSETLVLLAIADRADEHGRCWPSIEGIAERARVTPRSVQRIMRELEARGFVEIDQGGGRGNTNHYLINVEHLKGDIASPIKKGDASAQETLTPVAEKGDTAMSPESSVTVIEPSGLNRQAWKAWVGYRKTKKLRYTPDGALRQMQWLSRYTQDQQGQIVEQSVRQGYQGLFELKGAANGADRGSGGSRPSAVEQVERATAEWARQRGVDPTSI